VTFGLASVHSQKLVAGTKHLNSGFSHSRQYGLLTLPTFVTGRVPKLGGGGNPHLKRIPTPRLRHAAAIRGRQSGVGATRASSVGEFVVSLAFTRFRAILDKSLI
jgi:hypothetical protein